jgi:hypothetical protein
MVGPEILVVVCLEYEFIDGKKQSIVCASQYVLSATTPYRLSSCLLYTRRDHAQVATRIILR